MSLEELTHGLAGGGGCTTAARTNPGNFGVLTGARHCHAFPTWNHLAQAGSPYSRHSKKHVTFIPHAVQPWSGSLLSTSTKRTEVTGSPVTSVTSALLTRCRCAFNVSCIGHLVSSLGTPSPHPLFASRRSAVPPLISLQVTHVLDDAALEIVMRDLMAAPTGHQATVQHRVLDVLIRPIIMGGLALRVSTGDIRHLVQGVEDAHHATPDFTVQASGHVLIASWETIFEVLGNIYWPTPSDPALESG